MKALDLLTNVDRAALLHQLFPGEIPAILEFVKGMCTSIKEDEQTNRQNWKNGLFTFDYWLALLNEVENKIRQYNVRLFKNHRLFADQLFVGLLACYTAHCIRVFVTVRQHPNPKFVQAFDLLFNP